MNDTILVGQGRSITTIPRKEWEGHLSKIPEHFKIRLGFMTAEHHLVRYFVVSELLRVGVPIKPETISQKLNLPFTIVNTILDELEKRLFFLVRNEQGAVSWAYPVTVDKTPHRLTFDNGEALYAA